MLASSPSTASSLEEFALRASGSGAPRRSALEAVSEERAQDAATQWHLLPVAQPAQRAESEREVVAECGRLSGDPLDVTQTFTRHALRLGAWPSCFRTWFQKRYGES